MPPHRYASPATTASPPGTVLPAVTTCDSSPPTATPWPRWRKSSPAPAPPPTPTTPTCATRRIQPRRAVAQWAVGPVPRGPVPHPARGHPRTSNGAAAAGARRCPTMRKRAYGAAALFAFLVVQLWPAARYTQGHGLHWQLHLVAHAITGGRDPHRVGVRRRARLADGAAHEQRSR